MDLLKQVPKTVGKDIKVGKQLYTSGKRIYDAQAERSSIKKKFTAVGKTIKQVPRARHHGARARSVTKRR